VRLGGPRAIQKFCEEISDGRAERNLWIVSGAEHPCCVEDPPSDDWDQNDKQRSCYWWFMDVGEPAVLVRNTVCGAFDVSVVEESTKCQPWIHRKSDSLIARPDPVPGPPAGQGQMRSVLAREARLLETPTSQ
jgi:hypothetical protein